MKKTRTRTLTLDCQPMGQYKAVYIVTINNKPDSVWDTHDEALRAVKAIKTLPKLHEDIELNVGMYSLSLNGGGTNYNPQVSRSYRQDIDTIDTDYDPTINNDCDPCSDCMQLDCDTCDYYNEVFSDDVPETQEEVPNDIYPNRNGDLIQENNLQIDVQNSISQLENIIEGRIRSGDNPNGVYVINEEGIRPIRPGDDWGDNLRVYHPLNRSHSEELNRSHSDHSDHSDESNTNASTANVSRPQYRCTWVGPPQYRCTWGGPCPHGNEISCTECQYNEISN